MPLEAEAGEHQTDSRTAVLSRDCFGERTEGPVCENSVRSFPAP